MSTPWLSAVAALQAKGSERENFLGRCRRADRVCDGIGDIFDLRHLDAREMFGLGRVDLCYDGKNVGPGSAGAGQRDRDGSTEPGSEPARARQPCAQLA